MLLFSNVGSLPDGRPFDLKVTSALRGSYKLASPYSSEGGASL